MMERERINIILFGKSAAGGKVFDDALSNLELPHCIINLRSVNQTTSYLSSTSPSLPNVLIFYVSKPSNTYLIHIKIISEVAKYKNLSILIYDPTGIIDEEESFAAG